MVEVAVEWHDVETLVEADALLAVVDTELVVEPADGKLRALGRFLVDHHVEQVVNSRHDAGGVVGCRPGAYAGGVGTLRVVGIGFIELHTEFLCAGYVPMCVFVARRFAGVVFNPPESFFGFVYCQLERFRKCQITISLPDFV